MNRYSPAVSICLILLISLLRPVYSQNLKFIEELRDSISVVSSDSQKLELNYLLNQQWAEYNFDSSIYYANKVQQIAERINDPKLIRKGITAMGIAYDYQNKFDTAIYYYGKAGDYALENGDLTGTASSLFNIGVLHSFSGEMEKAIEKYLEAGKIYEKLGNEKMISSLHNNLGIIYRKTGKYELAQLSYLKSLAIKKSLNDKSGELSSLTNLSSVLRYLGKFDSAILISEQVLELSKEMDNQTTYLHELINIALAYKGMEDHAKARSYFSEAERLIDSESPYETKAQVYIALGEEYLRLDQLPLAKSQVNKMLDILEEDQKVEIAYNTHHLAYRIYKQEANETKALMHLESAFDLNRQLLDKEVSQRTTELEQLYEKERRESEIKELNAQNAINELELQQKANEQKVLIILVLAVISTAIFLFILFRQNRRSLVEKEVLLKEIHHRVKNNLQMISSLLNLQAGSLSDDAAVSAVKEGESRVMSMALIHERLYSTDDVRGVDLQEYVESLLNEILHTGGLENKEIDTNVNCQSLELDIDTVIPLGLIINELITNSIKYALKKEHHNQIIINITEENEMLMLNYKDSGSGINESNLEGSKSFGWKMIKSLCRKLKGEILLEEEGYICFKFRRYNMAA